MRLLMVLPLLVVLIGFVSCDTKNIGYEPPEQIYVNVTLTPDTAMAEGLTATMTITWTGGAGPYTIGINMGGGGTVDIPAGTPATSPFTQEFTLTDAGTYTYSVTVIDALTRVGSATGTYTIEAGGG